jgi:protocatechuate 3,4-dioxygenase beta subunit
MIHRTLTLILAIAANVLLTDIRLSACSCVASTPCVRGESSIIFRGQVESVSPNRARSRLKVLEVFAGKLGAAVDLAASGSTCDVGFTVGEAYVVYASEFKGAISTSQCSGTSLIQHAQEDLGYLRSRQFTNPSKAQIVGETVASQGASAAGIRVFARRGKTVLTAVPDSAGRFAIEAPPGSYVMSAESTSGTAVRLVPEWVALGKAQRCQPVALYVDRDNRLTGRVLDARGRPVDNLPVDAVRLRRRGKVIENGGTLARHAVRTDAKGAFVLRGLPPGLYAVAINPTRGRGLGIPTVYAPGVAESAQAQLFEIQDSVATQTFEIRLPPKARLIPISGSVRDTTGRAAAGVRVTLFHADGGQDGVFSDESGQFRLVAAPGEGYTLMAHSNGLQAGGVSVKMTLSEKTGPTILTLQPFRTK